MTKKASIFKTFSAYFRTHPAAVLGWIWVTVMPGIGSLFLLSNYQLAAGIAIDNFIDHLVFTVFVALVLGLALLPTTLTALAAGFYFGWGGLPGLLLGYLCANVIGYSLGKVLNTDFLSLLYSRKPELQQELNSRIQHPQSLIFFVRISPLIPFAISNFIFASFRIGLEKVLLFGIPGMLPRTLLAFATGLLASSFMDAKNSLNEPWQLAIVTFLLLFSLWGLYRSWKKTSP
jgi:uncharacterized membrane protein YdjX (TVP38/TMEM64 family)